MSHLTEIKQFPVFKSELPAISHKNTPQADL